MDFRPHSDFNRSKERVDRITHEKKAAQEKARWQGALHHEYLNDQLGKASNGIKHPKKMGGGTFSRPQFDDPERFDEGKKPPYQQKGWKGVSDDNYDDRT